MKIVDLPQSILRTTQLTWTMDMNHGYLASGFSGVGQVQRGQLERWQVAFTFQSVREQNAHHAEEFFLNLEGPANLFRFHDPSRSFPRGQVWRELFLAEDHIAGQRRLKLRGFPEKLYQAFLPGDWIQVGHQLTKVRRTVTADVNGHAEVEVWPKLWQAHAADTPVIYKRPKGLFRFLSDLPEWDVTAGTTRPYSFKLTGMQEVIPEGHPLLIDA